MGGKDIGKTKAQKRLVVLIPLREELSAKPPLMYAAQRNYTELASIRQRRRQRSLPKTPACIRLIDLMTFKLAQIHQPLLLFLGQQPAKRAWQQHHKSGLLWTDTNTNKAQAQGNSPVWKNRQKETDVSSIE
jgi:hypothetical protein